MIDHGYAKEHIGQFLFMDSVMVQAFLEVDFKTTCLTHNKMCEIHVKQKDETQSRHKRHMTCVTHILVLLHKLHDGLQLYHKIAEHEHSCSGKFVLNNNNCVICHHDITWICNQELIPVFDK